MTTHTMTLASTSGKTECWTCPICGRVLLITWEPWKKITLVDGDQTAGHTGGKGLRMSAEIKQNSIDTPDMV